MSDSDKNIPASNNAVDDSWAIRSTTVNGGVLFTLNPRGIKKAGLSRKGMRWKEPQTTNQTVLYYTWDKPEK